MADKKITELTAHTVLADADSLPIVDSVAGITKKVTLATMTSALQDTFNSVYGVLVGDNGWNGTQSFNTTATSGGKQTLNVQAGNHTDVTANFVQNYFAPNTITITGSFDPLVFTVFEAPTITAATALTVSNSATLVIGGAPIAAGSAVITNTLAFWVQSGASQFNGDINCSATVNGDNGNFVPQTNVPALIANGANITSETNISLVTGNVSGNLMDIVYPAAKTLTGGLLALNIDLATNVTTASGAGKNVQGVNVSLPSMSTTSANTAIRGFNVASAGAITNATAGSIGWDGLQVVMPVVTQSAGGNTRASGVKIVMPASGAIVTNGQMFGLDIIAPTTSGPAAGNLAGVNIRALTSAGAGTENAIQIGTGWDALLNYNGASIINSTGNWVGPAVGAAYGGTGVANNAASTITISGAYATTLTVSNTTSLTLPTTGTLATLAGAETFTNKTVGAGALTLAENASIALNPAGSADGKYSGITITGTGGATIAFGRLVYLKTSDSQWYEADFDAASTSDMMLGMTVTSTTDNNPVTVLLIGQIRADASFPALTVGAPVYGGETAGDIQVAIPTGADAVVRRVGFALTADEIYFNPSMDSQTVVA